MTVGYLKRRQRYIQAAMILRQLDCLFTAVKRELEVIHSRVPRNQWKSGTMKPNVNLKND